MTTNAELPEQVRRWHALVRRDRELERRESYTDEILDALGDVFYVVDANGDLLRWNDRLRAVTGYTDTDLAAMNVIDFFAVGDRPRITAALEVVADDGRLTLDADLVTSSGAKIPFEFVGVALDDPAGEPVVAGIGRDVTERKRLETDLCTEKEHFRVALENAPIVAFRQDTDLRYTWIGTPHPDFRPEDVVGKRDDELVAPEVAAVLMAPKRKALETGERVREELTYELPSGEVSYDLTVEPLFDDDGEVVELTCCSLDVTDRKRREHELERTRELLEYAQRLAGVGGWSFDVVDGVPTNEQWTDELYQIYEHESDEPPDLLADVQQYHSEDRDRVRTALTRAIEVGEPYDLEARLRTASGATRWVRTMGVPTSADGSVTAVRGSVQDVTTQKHHESALQSVYAATRGLLQVETARDVADLVVEVAADVLELSAVALYVLDDDANEFEPVAVTPAFVDNCDEPTPIAVGDGESPVWRAFVDGSQTVQDCRSDPNARAFEGDRRAHLVPIGDHGVFVTVSDEPTLGDSTRQLVETLVATAVAAFDRLESDAHLRQRDVELEQKTEHLSRQVAINELIRTVDQTLVRATSREEIERVVCERLVRDTDIEFAWIGDVTREKRDPVIRTWHGTAPAYLDAVTDDGNVPSTEPAWNTARTESPTVVRNVVDRFREEPWRRTALSFGYRSAICVPLVYDEFSYGLLALYATESSTFGDLEREVFEELGTTIASSINAVETRQALSTGAVSRLNLRITDTEGFLMSLASEANCRIAYEGMAATAAGETQLFLSISDADPEVVRATLERSVPVVDYTPIDESETELRLEVRVTGPVIAERLIRHGASPRSIVADPESMEVVVDVSTEADVRELLCMLGDQYPSVELVSRLTHSQSMHTERELVESIVDSLSPRQREVLNAAYFFGFFEWPRERTGEEVANLLGVSQPTVNRHLRLGQKTVLAQLFGERDGSTGAAESHS